VVLSGDFFMAPRPACAIAAVNQEKKLTRQAPTESEVTKWLTGAVKLEILSKDTYKVDWFSFSFQQAVVVFPVSQ